MKDLATDIEGDLDFVVGMIQGEDEIAQSIKLELSTNINEWFLDTTYGVDMSVFTDKNRPEEINDAIADVVAKEPRVELDDYVTSTFDPVSRKVVASFTVNLLATGQPIELEVVL